MKGSFVWLWGNNSGHGRTRGSFLVRNTCRDAMMQIYSVNSSRQWWATGELSLLSRWEKVMRECITEGNTTCNWNLQLAQIESEGMQRGTGDQIIPRSQQVLASSALMEVWIVMRGPRLNVMSHNKRGGRDGRVLIRLSRFGFFFWFFLICRVEK